MTDAPTAASQTSHTVSLGRLPLRESVRELLLGRILSGEYSQGHRLVECLLAQEEVELAIVYFSAQVRHELDGRSTLCYKEDH